MSYFGQSIKRVEDPRLITGIGSYVDDISLPNMLHAIMVRSPHAQARIVSVDVAQAASTPGVAAVLAGEDIAGILRPISTMPMSGDRRVDEFTPPEHPALAQGMVHYVGQPVAIVVARDRYTARDAADLVRVDYEPMEPLLDPLEAAKDDSRPVHEELGTNIALRLHHDRQGADLDEAFAKGDRIVHHQFDVQRLAPVPMETRGLIAHYRPEEGALTVWCSNQHPHAVKTALASLLDLPEEKVRVVAPDVGGGFGEKGGVFAEDLATSYLSVKLGQPVKWMADRQENMLSFHGRGHIAEVEASVQNDGTILGLRMRLVGDGGAFYGNSTPSPPFRASHRIIGPYKTPAARIEVVGVVTNKPTSGAYRGAGGPESAFCMERLMDLVARELDLDPAEVRRTNLIPPDAFPYETPTGLLYDSGTYEEALDRALELSDYRGWRQRAKKQNQDSSKPLMGVGVATVIKMSGGSGGSRGEEGWIKIEPTGEVIARTGISPHGQGSETAFGQVLADELGVSLDQIQVLHSDTDVVPHGGGTGATRATVVGGSALYLVAQEAKAKLSSIASHLLKCPAEEIEIRDGRAFSSQDPNRSVPFADVAAAAYSEEMLPPGVEPGLDFSGKFTLEGSYQSPHSFAAHVVVVEVDRDTGDTQIVKYVAVHDCGRIINPMLVEGQVQGAIVQGIGQALTEGMLYDSDGQPLTASLMDYAVPIAEELPTVTTDTLQTPSPMNPLGIKGIGELPTVAAPACVANAVMDALSGYGVSHIETPLTSEKVWRVMHGDGQ